MRHVLKEKFTPVVLTKTIRGELRNFNNWMIMQNLICDVPSGGDIHSKWSEKYKINRIMVTKKSSSNFQTTRNDRVAWGNIQFSVGKTNKHYIYKIQWFSHHVMQISIVAKTWLDIYLSILNWCTNTMSPELVHSQKCVLQNNCCLIIILTPTLYSTHIYKILQVKLCLPLCNP